jgi:hypothetical protein
LTRSAHRTPASYPTRVCPVARLSETLYRRDRKSGAWARAVLRPCLSSWPPVWSWHPPPQQRWSRAGKPPSFPPSRDHGRASGSSAYRIMPKVPPARLTAMLSLTHRPVLLTVGWTGRHRRRKSAPATVRHHGGQCTSPRRRGRTILERWIPPRTSPHERRYCRRHRGRSEFR